LPGGGALGTTVEANDADEACRKAAARLLDITLPEVDRMMERAELEVIAVIKGDPQFEPTKKTPLFPGL
jgi:CheY-like chemotaxis protein